MTTNYHTPLTGTDVISMATLNGIFSDLDSGIAGGSITGTAGATLSERDFVYLDESSKTWKLLDSDAVATVAAGALRGIVTESGGIASAATGSITLGGVVAGFSGLTAWSPVYVGTTAGSYTQTRPNVSDGGGQVAIIEMGYAVSASDVIINPKRVIYAERESLANNGTLTIEHHSDAASRLRQVYAYVATTVAGTSFTSYASSNYDTDVAMRDRAPATYGTDQCTGGTATASTSFSTNTPDKAFNDSAADGWSTSGASDAAWLEYDFGTTKTIRQYTIDIFGASNYPVAFTFQYYNGSSWVTVDTRSGLSWTSGEKKTFTVATAATAQRWRWNFTDSNTGDYHLAECEMMEAATFTDGPDKLGQSFQVTGTQTVKTVDLYLKKVGSPAGTMTLRIETDSAGSPSGTLADANLTTTLAESSLSTSYADVTFTFSTAASISGSTTYWLVLSTDRAASETNYVQWGADGSTPGYASGEMKSEASSSWSAESADAVFDVVGEGTQYDEPLAIGSVTGAGEEIGVRFDDGAGSDGNIKTTFKNLTGATADVVCEVVL